MVPVCLCEAAVPPCCAPAGAVSAISHAGGLGSRKIRNWHTPIEQYGKQVFVVAHT